MLRINRVSSMIFSFGTMWRSEEQIIFLICSTFWERWCCLCYIAYLGTENVVILKKKKSHIYYLLNIFPLYYLKTIDEKTNG